jgi:phage terminase large subunit
MKLETPRWLLPFFVNSRYKGAYGGRGSGKSWGFAEMMIEAHILNPDTNSVCIREIQKSLNQSVKRLLESKIELMGVGHLFEIQESQIKNRNGKGRIIFAGMQNHTSDSIKSLEGYDRAWAEESQSLSQKSLDMLRPTIRKPSSELWFTWNPSKSSDPIDLLLRGDHPPSGAIVQRVNYDNNPWFPQVLKDEMEYDKRRDPDKYAHIWRGEYVRNSEARVFKNWTIEEFEAPRDAEFRFGADWGFAVDPTVLVRCHLIGRKLYVDYEAYQVGCEILDIPSLFLTVPESEKWPIIADSARPETISHMRKNGFPKIMSATKGPGSIEDGIEWLKSYDIVVHPRCQHIIDELTLYSYKTDSLTGLVTGKLQDANNHCLVAGTMVETARGSIPIEEVLEGDFALTKNGFKKVTFSGMTDVNREVVRVETTGGAFVCTPDHEVFTYNRGFTRADALRYTDEVCLINSEKQKRLFSADIGIDDTQIVHADQTERISLASRMDQAHSFIVRFGKALMARSQMDFTFTMLTEIRSITTSLIWSAFLQRITPVDTLGVTRNWSDNQSTLNQFGISQRHGTQAQKDSQSIERSVDWLTRASFQLKRIARNVRGLFCLRSWGTKTSSALMPVSQRGGEAKDSTTSLSSVRAEKSLCPISTQKHKLAVGRVLTVTSAGIADEVYDLTVENEHEFFANGVLVSNCLDALRYSTEGVRRIAKQTRKFDVPMPSVSHW